MGFGEQGNIDKISKGTREHELIFREQGNKTLQIRGRKHCKQIHYKGNKHGKRAGTWEHRTILEGNKGTRNPPGRPSKMKRKHFMTDTSFLKRKQQEKGMDHSSHHL